MSRKNTLDYRELSFRTLSALVQSFKEAYEDFGHKILKVTVGLPFGHNEKSMEPIHWHFLLTEVENERAWYAYRTSLVVSFCVYT
jgi:hypothetical protein